MIALIRDLVGRRARADAGHAGATAGHVVNTDPVFHARLHHMRGVQRAFLGMVGRLADLTPPPVEGFPTVAPLAAGAGAPFDSGHGRAMKEWIALANDASEWPVLAREAHDFVAGTLRAR